MKEHNITLAFIILFTLALISPILLPMIINLVRGI